MGYMYPPFLVLLALVALSALFSACETALISVSKSKVDDLVATNVPNSRLLKKLKQNPHRLLITVLIASNAVNISASTYSVVVFTDLFGSSGLGIATGVMTFFILVFGEITPKSFAHKYAVSVSLWTARFVYILQIVLFPVVWIFDKIVFLTNLMVGAKNVYTVTEGEIVAMLKIGEQEGVIEKQEKELIENVLEFNDIEVAEVMTPRVSIEALDSAMSIQEAVKYAIPHSHTRLPVYEGNIDNIVGVLSVKELLKYSETYSGKKKLKSLKLMQPLQVPLSKKINKLFREFQRRHVHIAIVIDEFGGTAGLVTLENLLEEIVGEIMDESDLQNTPIQVINNKTIITSGSTLIEDINDFFKVKLAENERDSINTLLTEQLHRFPREGEVVKLPRAKATILEMHKNIVKSVKITIVHRKTKMPVA